MSVASAAALALFLPAILFSSFANAHEACTEAQQDYYGRTNDTLQFAYKFWSSYIYGAVPLLVSCGCTWLYLTASPSPFSKLDEDFHRIVGMYYAARFSTNLVCTVVELAFTPYPYPYPYQYPYP